MARDARMLIVANVLMLMFANVLMLIVANAKTNIYEYLFGIIRFVICDNLRTNDKQITGDN